MFFLEFQDDEEVCSHSFANLPAKLLLEATWSHFIAQSYISNLIQEECEQAFVLCLHLELTNCNIMFRNISQEGFPELLELRSSINVGVCNAIPEKDLLIYSNLDYCA